MIFFVSIHYQQETKAIGTNQLHRLTHRFCKQVQVSGLLGIWSPFPFLGASPQPPWVGFAEFWVWISLQERRSNAFASFLEKNKTIGTSQRPISRSHVCRGLGVFTSMLFSMLLIAIFSVGYAFISFVAPEHIITFAKARAGTKW
jgi:hypothetical protein